MIDEEYEKKRNRLIPEAKKYTTEQMDGEINNHNLNLTREEGEA